MSIPAERYPYSNNKPNRHRSQQFVRIPEDRVRFSQGIMGVAPLKRRTIAFSIIVLWLFLRPVCANADQCVEGDCVNGKGTMIYSTGHKYVGEFVEGKRNGNGIIYMPLDRTLRGRFQRNDPIEGTYTRPNGMVYNGQWEFRERNGRGILKYPNGRIYEGEFKSGLRNGKGVMIWPDGRRFEGQFVRGKRTGEGTMLYPDGRVYRGDFRDGQRSGSGVMTFPNGERLDGHFVDGHYLATH